MRIAREDVPGPVLTVAQAASEDEAIAGANEIALGLGASVWTADRYKAQRIAAELRVGMVWVNDHLVTRAAPEVPWGGTRGAGLGRARGAIALRTCAEPKVVTWDPPRGRPWWWFPYDAGLVKAGRTVARMRSARDADREAGLREGACRRCAWRRAHSGAVLDQPELPAGAGVWQRIDDLDLWMDVRPAFARPSRNSAATRSATASPPSRSSTSTRMRSGSRITL